MRGWLLLALQVRQVGALGDARQSRSPRRQVDRVGLDFRLRVPARRSSTLRSRAELIVFDRAPSLDATLCGKLTHNLSNAALRSTTTQALRR